MKQDYPAKVETIISASRAAVWKALTDPQAIRQYLYGTEAISDWKPGSSIVYRGEWEGKPYEDKGTILEFEPGKSLVTSFFSPLSGLPDLPENYQTIRYQLSDTDGGTRLVIVQENNPSREEADRAEQNWSQVLGSLKNLVEGQA